MRLCRPGPAPLPRTSSARSSALTLWVSAPTLMTSTPVAGDLGDRVEGDATAGLDDRASVDQLDALAQLVEREVVEHDRVDLARGEHRLDLLETVDLHLDVRGVRQLRRRRADGGGDVVDRGPGGCPWPSRRRTARTGGCGRRRRRRHDVRARAAPAWSCGCRPPATPVPSTAATYLAVSVATPLIRWTRLSATRSACSTDRAGPETDASTSPAANRAPSAIALVTLTAKSRRVIAIENTSAPASTPGSRATRSAVARADGGHEGLRREVAERRVLLEGEVDDPLDLVSAEHQIALTAEWRAWAGSVSGKSVRKWPPRDSSPGERTRDHGTGDDQQVGVLGRLRVGDGRGAPCSQPGGGRREVVTVPREPGGVPHQLLQVVAGERLGVVVGRGVGDLDADRLGPVRAEVDRPSAGIANASTTRVP